MHPGDYGYQLFANAAWQAYQDGVKQKLICVAPNMMIYADTYMHVARVRISTLYPPTAIPKGWRVGSPSLTAAWHDALMSRWLDDVTIASNRQVVKNADGTTTKPR